MLVNKKLNVIVPMAGRGSRFEQEGFEMPKPLIDIDGRPMIQWVVENLQIDANYIFVVQQTHIDNYAVDKILDKIKPGCKIHAIDHITDGAARTVLSVKHLINDSNPILIVNSDNMIEWDSSVLDTLSNVDGGIVTIQETGPKWSYARLDSSGFVELVAEKVEISTNATTGHYYWAHGKDFVDSAEDMIAKDIRYNNEFYVAPVYNQAIEKGHKIVICPAHKFWSVGTPEDLRYFHANCDKSKV